VKGPLRVWNSVGQRALRIIPVAGGDAGRLSHPRAAPIGADDELGPQREALPRQPDAVGLGRDAGDQPRLMPDRAVLGELRRQGCDQLGVLDIPAEGRQPDFGGAELDRRLAEQAAGVVDEAHHGERRGPVGQRVDQAEFAEQPPGAVEQGDGAAVAMGRDRAEQGNAASAFGQRERGREPGCAGPDDGDVDLVHAWCRHAVLVTPAGRDLPRGGASQDRRDVMRQPHCRPVAQPWQGLMVPATSSGR